ncbi:MAG: TerD family protein [Microscillaceae bacterium]|jgi:tellurium resistance protein TerZ|nr:TerD family protein [Microscillaceae bacterium]
MSISLDKKTGINLKKGSSISLEKGGKKLEQVCIGLNWGIIEKKQFFGLLKERESVDLDGSVTMFDRQGNMIDTVYYRKLQSDDLAIKHSGDDRIGDSAGDDDLDNEVIEINLNLVRDDVAQIVFYLNSYKGQSFSTIPYSKIRIFEGSRRNVVEVFATFNLSAEASFAGKISMIMGKLVRQGQTWEFKAIGDAIAVKGINETIAVIQKSYLS